MKAVVLFAALNFAGCAACRQHPVICAASATALTAAAFIVATHNSKPTLQQYCRMLPDGTVRCGRVPGG